MNADTSFKLLCLLLPVVLLALLGVALVGDLRGERASTERAATAKQAKSTDVTTVWRSPETDAPLEWAQPGIGSWLYAGDGTDVRVVDSERRESVRLMECGDVTAVWHVLPREHSTTYYLVGKEDGTVILMRPDDNDEAREVARLSVFDRPILGFLPGFGRASFRSVRVGVAARGESTVKVIEVGVEGLSTTEITLEHRSAVEAVVLHRNRITADARGTLRGWSESGEEQWDVSLHRGGVAKMIRSVGRGYLLTVGSRDNTLKLFDTSRKEVAGEVRLRRGVVGVSAVHADPGLTIAYENGTVELWDISEITGDSRRRPRAVETLRVGSGTLLGAKRVNRYHLALAFEGERSVRLVQINSLAEPEEIPGRRTLPEYIYPINRQGTRKIGFIDATGRVVIEPVFSHGDFPVVAGTFQASFTGRNSGVFNQEREWVVNPPLTSDIDYTPLGPDRLRVYSAHTERYRLFDFDDNPLNDREFRMLDLYQDGRAVFQAENRRWGALDLEGNVAVEPDFEYMSSFKQGRAIARIRGESTSLIDRDGNKVAELGTASGTWDRVYAIGDGLVAIHDNDANESRAFDLDGNLQFTVESESIALFGFSEGYGRLLRDGVFSYIDREGNVVSDGFAEALPHIDGVAMVKSKDDDAWGLIDRDFNWITRGHTERMWRHPGPLFSVHNAFNVPQYYLNAEGERFEYSR